MGWNIRAQRMFATHEITNSTVACSFCQKT
jgi:hypothetical protein